MLEIIAEAAAHVSTGTRAMLPLPWLESVASRNRLVHGYFDIDEIVIWRTATEDIPLLAMHSKRSLIAKQEEIDQ